MLRDHRFELLLAAADEAALRDVLFTPDGCENFAVLFCGLAAGPDWTRLLVREWWPTPRSEYRQRLGYHLEIEPGFLNQVVTHAARTKLSPVLVHSHPASDAARYSPSDDWGESRLLPVLEQLLPGHRPASLLLSRNDAIARRHEGGQFVAFDAVRVVGTQSRIYAPKTREFTSSSNTSEFDRTIRAVGASGNDNIRSLKVGIVGLGGTGSAVAEELVRLGVADVTLIDHDRIEASNLPRLWGAYPEDAEAAGLKVSVIESHLLRIRPSAVIRPMAADIVRQSVITQLRDRDLVFGCTDNHLSRAMLNRFAHQYLVPLVDMGIRLDARSGPVCAAGGRVTVVGPGMTCLRCSGHIDPNQVLTECLPPEERASLLQEGYIQGLPEAQPSVISLNTTIASMAVTAGIGMFANLVGRPPSVDLVYDFTNTLMLSVQPRHVDSCDICTSNGGLRGLGDLQIVSSFD